MKKVFILGASGLLGVSLVKFLKEEGKFEILTHGNETAGLSIRGDLTDKAKTSEILNKINPDIIINLVALTNVDECEENPEKAYLINTKAVENVVDWIKGHSRTNIIHISTDHVYDKEGDNKEDNIVLRNYYAFSKYLAEFSVVQVDGVVLRTNFFGRSELSGRSSFSDWVFNAITKEENVDLLSDVYFSPLSIKTLCSMISLVMNKPLPGIYNLGSHAGSSKADFAINFSKVLDIKSLKFKLISVGSLTLKARRPRFMQMDVLKFEKTYQVQLPTLKEELELIKKDYL